MHLDHFSPYEFRDWWPLMSPKLLVNLDAFRETLGQRVRISKANGALGRHMGMSRSQHNVDKWGEVRAVDIMLPDTDDLVAAYDLALTLELFSGVGVYPEWKPYHGLHLDVRSNRKPQSPATWGMLKDEFGNQYMTSVNKALDFASSIA